MNTDIKVPSGRGDFLVELKNKRNSMKHVDVANVVSSKEVVAPATKDAPSSLDGEGSSVAKHLSPPQHEQGVGGLVAALLGSNTPKAAAPGGEHHQPAVDSNANDEVSFDDINAMNASMLVHQQLPFHKHSAASAAATAASGVNQDEADATTTTEAMTTSTSASAAMPISEVVAALNARPQRSTSTSRTPMRTQSMSSAKPAPKYRAPSPPRWRFVKEAKSTFGYSSQAAGLTVKGKSSHELGATYVAPKIVKEQWTREEREINDLGDTELQYKKFDKEGNEVGRLDIGDPDAEYEEFHEGGVVISHDPNNPNEPQRNWKEWMKFHGRNKDGKSSVAQAKDRYVTTIENESSSSRKYKNVGRLAFDPDDFEGEEFKGEFPRQKFERDSFYGDGVVGENGVGHSIANNQEGDDFQDNNGPPEEAGAVRNNPVDIDDLSSKLDMYDNDGPLSDATNNRRRRKWWPLLLLFLLLIAGAITGVVLGTREPQPEVSPEEGARVFAVVTMIDDNSTLQPSVSSQPSASPSNNGNSFGNIFDGVSNLELSRSNITDQPSAAPTVDATQTGGFGLFSIPEPPTSLLPSKAPTSSPTGQPSTGPTSVPTAGPSAEPSGKPTTEPTRQPTANPSQSPSTSSPTKQPIASLGACPEPFNTENDIYYLIGSQVSMQGIVYECMGWSCGSWKMPDTDSENWQVAGSCEGTWAPTSNPTASPTSQPTAEPSTSPTSSPSNSPVTSSPTKQPAVFLGGCPEPFNTTDSTIYYPIETQVSLNGIVYECIDYSCGSWVRPEATIDEWQVIGSCSGSISPTDVPTTSPTRRQSAEPSQSPSSAPSNGPMTLSPTSLPTRQPSAPPSNSPSDPPTEIPTPSPKVVAIMTTPAPTDTPTDAPVASPTTSPSASPTHGPSSSPTTSPTTSPSRTPSLAPTTKDPTTSPSIEPTDQPTKDPSISPTGQPTAGPTVQPTDDPTFEPTPSPTLNPSQNPTFEPTLNPTPSPTSSPTTLAPSKQPTTKPTNVPEPSRSPTDAPTAKPTCGKNGNFNLCLAIDMSGSVCNGDSNSLCTDCQPQQCNTGGQNKSRCCSNFDNIIQFTRSLVKALGELPTDQDFSIVHFGTDVNIATTLESSQQAFKSLNKLEYSGGKTNMAGAINSCQTTLSNSPPDRKNLVLLITDGAPSVPTKDAPLITELAATDVKNQGTFIVPILIEDPANQFIPEVAFLKNRISSDGKVFVADFDGLGDIQDAVFDQVTCQS